jgi:Dirigent-like protein
MKTSLVVFAVAAIAAVVVPAAQSKTVTIKVMSVQSSSNPVDKPPHGASKGDSVASTDRLLNAVAQFGKKKGAIVGSDSGTMTLTSAHTASFKGSATLPGGTLTIKGKVVAMVQNILRIPITAGTGKYQGAHGYLLIGPGSKRAENVYVLVLPSAPVA